MSFLSLLKKISVYAILISLIGCQSFQTKERKPPGPHTTEKKESQTSPSPVLDFETEESEAESKPEISAPVLQTPSLPKLGIILGPGAAKAYAHAGFLQELSKSKVPVAAVAGIEWGALIAGIYSQRESANDVEWQLLKLKEQEIFKRKIFNLSSEANEFSILQPSLKDIFSSIRTQEHRVPFACPAFRYKTMQSFIMAKGNTAQVVSYCMSSLPLIKPYNGYVAGFYDISKTADFLRSKGANFIVYVNVLSGGANKGLSDDTFESIYWQQVAEYSNRKLPGVDYKLNLSIKEYGLMDFKNKRDIIRIGSDQGYKELKSLLKKWNL